MEIIELACWPVKKNKVEQCLKDIVTQKNVFIESLNVEHMWVARLCCISTL